MPGVAVFDGAFGEDGDPAGLRGFNGETQAGDTGAEDEIIGRLLGGRD